MKAKYFLIIALLVTVAAIISSCESETEQTYNRYYTAGLLVYQSRCQNCHGVNGDGLGALIPPLQDSVYLRRNLGKLPCFIKGGLKAPITVNSKLFNSVMPPQPSLSPIEVAEVMTYVTNSFGNKMGLTDAPRVTADLANCN